MASPCRIEVEIMEMNNAKHCRTAIMILSFFLSGAFAQQMPCISQLLPCLNIVNSSRNPPESCCGSLKHAIKDMPECLCSMMSTRGAFLAELVGINVTKLQQLPEQCGQHVDFLGCLTGTPDTNTHVPNNDAGQWFRFIGVSMAIVLSVTMQVLLAL